MTEQMVIIGSAVDVNVYLSEGWRVQSVTPGFNGTDKKYNVWCFVIIKNREQC